MGVASDRSSRPKDRLTRIAVWATRLCFTLVFILNVQCALSYVVAPDDFVGGFQLTGVEGAVAVQGLGIAFLMWNATYPAFIARPLRFKVLGFVILVQQAIGLVGESMLCSSLPLGFETLSHTIIRFIVFDAAGLIFMLASLAFLLKAQTIRDKNSD